MISIFKAILCVLQAIASYFLWAMVEFINLLIAAIGGLVAIAISPLPDMPDIPTWTSIPYLSDIVNVSNWLFPLDQLVLVLAFAVSSWIIWQVAATLLRAAKVQQ